MNSVMFMSCSDVVCSKIVETAPVLLTFAIVGVILILMSILANIVYVKCSQRSGYNSICWNNIKPNNDNTFLGFLFGLFGFAFVFTPLFIYLIFGIYKFFITL